MGFPTPEHLEHLRQVDRACIEWCARRRLSHPHEFPHEAPEVIESGLARRQRRIENFQRYLDVDREVGRG